MCVFVCDRERETVALATFTGFSAKRVMMGVDGVEGESPRGHMLRRGLPGERREGLACAAGGWECGRRWGERLHHLQDLHLLHESFQDLQAQVVVAGEGGAVFRLPAVGGGVRCPVVEGGESRVVPSAVRVDLGASSVVLEKTSMAHSSSRRSS